MPNIHPDRSQPDQCLSPLETMQLAQRQLYAAARGDAAPEESRQIADALGAAIADLGGPHPDPADCLSAGACAWCERAEQPKAEAQRA